jgi:hypothetical protein
MTRPWRFIAVFVLGYATGYIAAHMYVARTPEWLIAVVGLLGAAAARLVCVVGRSYEA